MVGISIFVPNKTSNRLISFFTKRLSPPRSKILCGKIFTRTYRSPAPAPRSPVSPAPESFINCSLLTPGAISTETSLLDCTRPEPRQSEQILLGTWPLPEHLEQGRTWAKLPKKVLRDSLISPRPLQVAHSVRPTSAK